MVEILATLYTKLAKISASIGAVQKDAKHGQGYGYHSADAVMSKLNHLLADHNVVIIPTAANAKPVEAADGVSRWSIDYTFVVACGDTGASFEATWTGEAPMSMNGKPDDKAMGKAHTYAFKYWLMKLFKISTVDEADLDQNDLDAESRKPAQKPQAQKNQAPANVSNLPQAWSKQEQQEFWAEWFTEAKFSKDAILSALGVKTLGEWKYSLATANERMETYEQRKAQ